MSLCKGVYNDVKKLSELLDLELKDDVIELIAAKNEEFIKEILDEANHICLEDKRKM